jgi:apolipoprotein N-acyltransferase
VAVIQGNVGQGDKMGDPEGLFKSYAKLHAQARAQRPDLIVWPETCCPMDWFDIEPGASEEGMPTGFGRARAKSRFTLLGEAQWGAPTLLGLTGLEWDGTRVWKYNSALLLKPLPKPDGWKPGDPLLISSTAAGRYDKMHLVPFGEYVPLKDQLPFMSWFTPYKHEYSCRPGEHWTRFPLKSKDGRDFTFGCLICYEDSDPYLARQYVASDPVNFLVNISNDGWFDGTEEHEQHLAICRFRAVEARRAIVRSVNMGISGVIDADGRIVALPNSDWSQSKKVEAVVTHVVPIDSRAPLYATLGDWIPAACWLAALVGVVLAMRKRASAGASPTA